MRRRYLSSGDRAQAANAMTSPGLFNAHFRENDKSIWLVQSLDLPACFLDFGSNIRDEDSLSFV